MQQTIWKQMVQILWPTIHSIMDSAINKRNHPNKIRYNVQWARWVDGISLCVVLYSYWNFLWHGIKWALFSWHQISITPVQMPTSPINARQLVPHTNSIEKRLRKPFKWHGIWCVHINNGPMHLKRFSCLAFWWEIWFSAN